MTSTVTQAAPPPRSQSQGAAHASLHESRIRELAASTGPLTVDEEKCIVYGVKILGERSINPPPDNNIYPKTTREKVIPLIEGARAHVDHWDKEPSYKDSFGVHRNVRESGTGLISDIHCNPHHPITKQFLWDARNNPRNVGFSLNSSATKRWTPDGAIVESINFSPVHHSVDLVHHGATTSSLHESARQATAGGAGTATVAGTSAGTVGASAMSTATTTTTTVAAPFVRKIGDILKNAVRLECPWQVAAYARIREAAGDAVAADVATGDPAAPAEKELSGDEQVEAALKAMIGKVIDDDGMDVAAKVAKIEEILTAQDALLASVAPEEKPAAESAKGKKSGTGTGAVAEVVKIDRSSKVLDIIIAESVTPSKYLTRALLACDTDADMRDTIRDYKERVKESSAATGFGGSHAVVSGGRTAGTTTASPPPTNVQEAARNWFGQ